DARGAPTTKIHTEGKHETQVQARQEGREVRQENKHSVHCPSRQWKKEETSKWWETRYHQKERQGDQKGHDKEQHQEQEEKQLRISKSASVSSRNSSDTQVQEVRESSKVKKPELIPPKVGVFALYYLLTKMGILSDGTSNFAYKKEVELVDIETTETHKKRLEDIKEAINKEQDAARWGIAAKVFSWIAFLIAIITGIVLIATGVGAVAGAMLIAGGAIQIASQIMELSGGWQKIAAMLPGDDIEKKRAVINWMQIGITVLCLILSAAGVIWGGVAHFKESMQTAMRFIGGIAAMGQGVVAIGEGIADSNYKNKMSDIKKFELRLSQLKHMRQDLMEKVELGIDRLEQLFEDLAAALDFEVELFQADQMHYRR
ncbi:MAG TPA: type III secretion system translocon subunit SctE, partial [Waddliaceae bacterium]